MKASATHEITFAQPLSIGATGDAVRRVQEWLTLSRTGVVIDGQFGAATAAAVSDLQQRSSLPVTGVVDSATSSLLVSPMTTALGPIAPTESLGADVVACAMQHVAQHPREIGGENSGPWVRLYMNGEQGTEFPWCAGLACTMIAQAAGSRPLPFEASLSCDELGKAAQAKGMLRPGAGIDPTVVHPGSLFLVKKKDGSGWHHTGIVVSAAPDSVTTIEGNTNDDGSREGYEAIRRIRSYNGIDFIVYES
jgi:peptidoglycan hydrolase-like protein with peptidoglycan-binding domain